MKNLYDESHLWVRQNYQKGDECFVIIKYNEQKKARSLVHAYLLRDKFLDVRGGTDDFDKIIEPFDCGDYETFGFNTLEQFINFVVEIMREMK